MTYTPAKTLTLDQFLAQHGADSRYELIDGELRDLEPTGPHETVAGKVAGYLFAEILRSKQRWTIPKTCLVSPPAAQATALRPDVIVLDEAALEAEPLWQQEPVVTSGQSIVMVVEVVSTNWQDDYARKVEEYSLLGISEYWIVDFRGLGGIDFIGRPKQPTLTVCQLMGEDYKKTQYRLRETLKSNCFPELRLKLEDLMESTWG
ncbi:MAG: Uma2 family endonuclease [Cyanobacteria bacterium Co-bin8]|nr:Uma2 family endonuclease [Cyanobacteria bacterium Co-bin8]